MMHLPTVKSIKSKKCFISSVPDVDEDAPELVVDSSGIFQPEYKNVFRDYDRVEVEKSHGFQDHLSQDVDVAKAGRKWPSQEPDVVDDGYRELDDARPAC